MALSFGRRVLMTAIAAIYVVAVLDGLAQNANLKIIVIEGEGAVNIIQQKTAVAPIVEVRDRNNLPVSGATVTFSIGGGNSAAFAGGAQTLTVTTNAAGRAAAAALNPLGGGSFQIRVSAAFQGQTAAATIAQTNVLTAAEAAAQAATASGAGSSSGGTAMGGAASGGGGGLSGTTIGILGVAVGGGVLVATRVGGLGGDSKGETDTGSFTGPMVSKSAIYTGLFTGQMVFTQNTGGTICDSTRALAGTLTMTLEEGTAKGKAEITGTSSEIAFTASPFCSPTGNSPLDVRSDVTGPAAALAFSEQISFTSTSPAVVTATTGYTFAGALNSGVVTGTLTYTLTTAGQQGQGGSAINGRGSTTMPVTLR